MLVIFLKWGYTINIEINILILMNGVMIHFISIYTLKKVMVSIMLISTIKCNQFTCSLWAFAVASLNIFQVHIKKLSKEHQDVISLPLLQKWSFHSITIPLLVIHIITKHEVCLCKFVIFHCLSDLMHKYFTAKSFHSLSDS